MTVTRLRAYFADICELMCSGFVDQFPLTTADINLKVYRKIDSKAYSFLKKPLDSLKSSQFCVEGSKGSNTFSDFSLLFSCFPCGNRFDSTA